MVQVGQVVKILVSLLQDQAWPLVLCLTVLELLRFRLVQVPKYQVEVLRILILRLRVMECGIG